MSILISGSINYINNSFNKSSKKSVATDMRENVDKKTSQKSGADKKAKAVKNTAPKGMMQT